MKVLESSPTESNTEESLAQESAEQASPALSNVPEEDKKKSAFSSLRVLTIIGLILLIFVILITNKGDRSTVNSLLKEKDSKITEMNFNITKLNQDISKKDLQILKLKDDLDEQKLKLSAFTSEEQFETISIE